VILSSLRFQNVITVAHRLNHFMNRTNYIFIDFENVQEMDLERIANPWRFGKTKNDTTFRKELGARQTRRKIPPRAAFTAVRPRFGTLERRTANSFL
jgi:hypothetical protein